MSQGKVSIDVVKLIEFYDQKSDIKKPASSISGLIGEDLIAGLFKHYLENYDDADCDKVEIIDDSIKAYGTHGKMLDRWILHHKINGQKIAYQTEIKNWSVHSLGGKTFDKLDLKYPYNNILKNAKENFERNCAIDDYGKMGFKDKSVGKVLLKMKPDKRTDNHIIKPLICFWMPICSNDEIKPYFEKECSSDVVVNPFYNECKFKSVSFFSASIYLRKLISDNPGVMDLSIEIFSTNIKQRLDLLKTLITEY